ncbi:MAG: hypothetical protein ACYC6I_04740 [Bacillota bacterium]
MTTATMDTVQMMVRKQWGVPNRGETSASRRGNQPSAAIFMRDLVPA